eukprot:s1096_g7.t1
MKLVAGTRHGACMPQDHMRRMLADKESCDVLLAAGTDASEEVAAHKCVLASRSSYFRALFSSEFRERSEGRVLLEDCFAQDISFEQLTYLLHFIYADDWLVEDPEFAFEMIPIADRFSVLDLKRLCERTLICSMSVANVARIFSMADRYSCTRLRSRALFFMTDTANFHSVMKTATFAELDKVLILEILHSHKAAPVPAPPPSEPLPGNSATLSKVAAFGCATTGTEEEAATQEPMFYRKERVQRGRLPDRPQQPMPFVEARPAAAVPPMCRPRHHIQQIRPSPKRPHRQAVPERLLLPAREGLQAPRPCSAHMEEGYQQAAAGTPPAEAGHRLAQNAPVVSPTRLAQSGDGLASESFFELGPD